MEAGDKETVKLAYEGKMISNGETMKGQSTMILKDFSAIFKIMKRLKPRVS